MRREGYIVIILTVVRMLTTYSFRLIPFMPRVFLIALITIMKHGLLGVHDLASRWPHNAREDVLTTMP